MDNIDISIIIPIYNVEKYLEKCLDTIYEIKGINTEIILVNDGSTDKSLKIINVYYERFFEKTRVINKVNGGLSSARNVGLEIAQGKYVSFIDSDDYVDSKKFTELFLEGEKLDLDIIIGRTKKIWKEKNYCEELGIPIEILDKKVMEGKEYLEKSFEYKNHRVEVWDDFYKREFLKENKLKFTENILHEDVPFTFKSFILAKQVKSFNIFFYYYRQREGSIMSSLNLKSYTSRIEIIKELLEFFQKEKINSKYFNNHLGGYIWSVFRYKEKIKIERRIILKLLKTRKYYLKIWIKLLILFIYSF